MESPATRSRTMQAVKSKNTAPELFVRRLLHARGYRYRLHRSDLPGCPDLVFCRRQKVIFVHGCFWHGHTCARGGRLPKTNADYWKQKIGRNRARDQRNLSALQASGWAVLVIWECELQASETLIDRITRFLSEKAV